ncbi:TIGR02710 family CRISPR-associated CARF protein [Methylomonas rhizoryzae]|uniref:TIGR02710 family CRISPR-associated CARF protein n=1 Tax=Methylomonas rhizoryzae TaxID=2608981 RepID=UPI00123245F4|nr:TIGR02710 family CRISPR-associated CARF protein [Methylomonas rhizoryzae]
MTQVLICTVGGSHQPIVSAINDMHPDYVVFICTDKDPATGKAGSNLQIEGTGSCIKDKFADEKPSLPNIPAQTGLNPNQFEIKITLADDLDRIYLDCSQVIDDLTARYPAAKIAADYTGGTKSMSAGLVMAALEHPDVELKLVTGTRSDLIKVQDGSQFSDSADCQQIRYQRLSAPYRQTWSRYAYSEAVAGLEQFKPPKGMRNEYTRLRELSRAFAEWDNFNHQTAFQILQHYASESLNRYLNVARALNDIKPEKRDAARLFDLYRNAQRRAAQGRYDDAIARIYRLIEWTAQWLLQTQCNLKTGDIQAEQIPTAMNLKPNRDGKYQVGLFDAWQLVKHHTQGPAAQFIRQQEKELLNHLKIRNNSILAHGFEPISRANWQLIEQWLNEHFIPMLLEEATKAGIKQMPPQLPDVYRG